MKKIIVGALTTATLLFGAAVPGTLTTNTVEASQLTYKDKAITEGKKVIGTPYKWGGTTTKGFDCSGFTSYAYKKAGKTIPRTTTDQYKRGKAVTKKQLQKGDLVFFQTYKKGASHVGIYMGKGQFIHASSTKGVSIASLENSYWKSKFYGAKRL